MARPRKIIQTIKTNGNKLSETGTMNESILLNEVIAKKRIELDDLKYNCTLKANEILSLKTQWEGIKREEEIKLSRKNQELETLFNRKMDQVEQIKRQAQGALDRASLMEQDAKARLLSVIEREKVVINLNKERLEISKLRFEVERQKEEVEKFRNNLLDKENNMNHQIQISKKIQQECEERNKLLDVQWSKINQANEEILLKKKDMDIVYQEIQKKLAELEKLEKNLDPIKKEII